MKFWRLGIFVMATSTALACTVATASAADGLSPKSQKLLYRIRNAHEKDPGMANHKHVANEILMSDPKCGDAFVLLGLANYENRDYKLALKEFAQAIELKPIILFYARSAYNYSYHIYINQKDWKNALKLGLQCYAIEPTSYVARDIALIYQKLGDQTNGKKYEALHSKLEASEKSMFQAGREMQDPAKLQAILKKFDTALAADPNNPELMAFHAGACLKAKEYQKSIADLNRLIAQDPSNAEYYVLRAQVYKKLGDEKKAEDNIRTAKDYGLEKAQMLSDAFDTADPQRVDSVLKKLNAALKADPKNVSSLEMRARCYLTKHDTAKALADLDTCVSIEPSSPAVYLSRARYLSMTGDKEKAAEDIKKAQELLIAAAKSHREAK